MGLSPRGARACVGLGPRGSYSRRHGKVPVPFALQGRATLLTVSVPFRFRSVTYRANCINRVHVRLNGKIPFRFCRCCMQEI